MLNERRASRPQLRDGHEDRDTTQPFLYRLLSNRRGYRIGETALLALSASVPAAAAAGAGQLALGILGGVVVVASGLRNIFDWRHSWVRAATTFAAMQQEYVNWTDKRGDYNTSSDEGSRRMLSQKIESLMRLETAAWATALNPNKTDGTGGGVAAAAEATR
ncbi:DUF4231 domain-containing protein [Kitasatospora griseola]|uniref:DUF4231 domain-containing protein n=1 Tax=Kitasatospora griseola TaxID=2064 RepID=UPI0013791FD2|nr:DUF4231 domain-containing protein [Kitasatospora griseola]